MTSKHLNVQPPAVPGLFDKPIHLLVSLFSKTCVPRSYRQAGTHLVPSQVVSILFTDVVGSSQLMEVWPLEGLIASLESYFQRLSRCVYGHRGEVDKFMGDGMMAVFESPDNAVRAAQSIQCEVAHYNLRQTEQAHPTFPTRIVVDTGRVIRTALGAGGDRDWTVLGPVVNTASNLAKTLPPDRVFISRSTYCRLTVEGDLRLAKPRVMSGHTGTLVVYEVIPRSADNL